MRKMPELPDRLGWRDYFQIVTTALMVVLGICVLWQTVFKRWALPPLIFGIASLLFGVIRIWMICIYFQRRGKKHGI